MKKKSIVSMRMELLDLGAKLGYPRLPYATGRRVRPGETAWTTFASSAGLYQLAPALRNAKTLAGYYAEPAVAVVDEKRQRMLDNLARARAARAERKAQREEVPA